MGLDQWLYKITPEGEELVIEWRKANQIHAYFDRLCDGVENLERYEVRLCDLENLRDTCQRVLDNRELAEKELPVMMGCFFGSYSYDEWYFDEVECTVNKLNKVLDNSSNDDEFCYQAWW